MKKLALGLVLGVLLLALPAAGFAQTANWDGQVHKGDVSVFGGIGFSGYGFSIVPGAEWAFGDWKVGKVVPLALGVAIKGSVNFYSSYWTAFGAGAFLTGHLGFKGLDIPQFLQNFDVYASAGLAFSYFSYNSTLPGWDLKDVYFGFATSEGTAYYFTEKFAVYGEYNYWAYSSNGIIGVLFKF